MSPVWRASTFGNYRIALLCAELESLLREVAGICVHSSSASRSFREVDTHAKELARLEALEQTRLLDSPPEVLFDRLTSIAARALNVPVSLISLVDKDRQFFKSLYGLPSPHAEARETPLSHSFCQHVVATVEPLIVEDARHDPLLSSNLAVRDLNVIAYAGVPLVDVRGNCLGSFCAIDTKPRQWSGADIELLKSLAAQTMTEIEMRSRTLSLAAELSDMRRKELSRRTITKHALHDLRTPLNSLLLGMEVLVGLNLTADQQEWTTLAQRSGWALKELLDDMIDSEAVSERGANALRVSESNALDIAGKAFDQIKGSGYANKITLIFDSEPNLPAIKVDEKKIIRVLVNLMGNAAKFTPSGGRIELFVGAREPDLIAFAVTDTGVGFSQEQGKTIFDGGVVLDQTAVTNFSTGWGLEFCKRTVEAHGGSIEVQSQVGIGSKFTVLLPASHRQGGPQGS